MGIVLAMYVCMMYALGYRRYRELGMVMECCGEIGDCIWVIVVCLIYSLLPQQNKKIINL